MYINKYFGKKVPDIEYGISNFNKYWLTITNRMIRLVSYESFKGYSPYGKVESWAIYFKPFKLKHEVSECQ